MAGNKCYSCGKMIKGTPVECANCGNAFCEKHRAKDAHGCGDIYRERELYDGGKSRK